jgi:hypothetical protein
LMRCYVNPCGMGCVDAATARASMRRKRWQAQKAQAKVCAGKARHIGISDKLPSLVLRLEVEVQISGMWDPAFLECR